MNCAKAPKQPTLDNGRGVDGKRPVGIDCDQEKAGVSLQEVRVSSPSQSALPGQVNSRKSLPC